MSPSYACWAKLPAGFVQVSEHAPRLTASTAAAPLPRDHWCCETVFQTDGAQHTRVHPVQMPQCGIGIQRRIENPTLWARKVKQSLQEVQMGH